MIVVSDASPILSLSAINRLELLRDLYGAVVIPAAVKAEILAGASGLATLSSAAWIETRAVQDRSRAEAVGADLDEGESEAIVLALEVRADLVLMDERRGRIVAVRLGLRVVGLLGSLVEAKRRGLIPGVKPLVDELVHTAGFRISRSLYAEILQAAGESVEQ